MILDGQIQQETLHAMPAAKLSLSLPSWKDPIVQIFAGEKKLQFLLVCIRIKIISDVYLYVLHHFLLSFPFCRKQKQKWWNRRKPKQEIDGEHLKGPHLRVTYKGAAAVALALAGF